MVEAVTLGAFALTSLLIELTPGPNMAYLALIAATEGRRAGFAAVAGVALGLAIVGLAAALGLAALIDRSDLAYQVLRWTGIGYLVWLAWEAWRGADGDGSQAALGSPLRLYFRRGLVTNLLNPKAALFYVAVLPGFLTPGAAVTETVTLSAVYVAVATGVHGMIVAAAGLAQGWLADPARVKPVQRGLGLALLAVAGWVAWKT
ncbi:MAG: LysE family translocator [Tabrizicola sp.]|nr:LysE family translocator [Tabrizicola sp.]